MTTIDLQQNMTRRHRQDGFEAPRSVHWKVLSVRQPYAWAIIHAGKDIENRTWHSEFRGTVLIHAGLHWHAVGPEELSHRMGIAVPVDLPLGGIVGMVDVIDCVTTHPSPWFEGPYGYVLNNPKPLPFVACPGHLGFYDLDADLLRALGLP